MFDYRKNLKKKMDKYLEERGFTYGYFRKSKGLNGIEGIRQSGGTTFKTLFNTSVFLNIDIRNFLMVKNETVYFKKGFTTFEEFYIYLGKLFKKIREEKSITAREILNQIDSKISTNVIYAFENAKQVISLERFYNFLDVLNVSVDEFFLNDDELKEEKFSEDSVNEISIDREVKNKISIEEFNNRVYELEKIKNRNSGIMNLLTKPNELPTLHMFLNICRNLRITPSEFFDFDKKEFEKVSDFDLQEVVKYIKDILVKSGYKVNNYVKFDLIFLFCDKNQRSLKNFFDYNCVLEDCVKNMNKF